MFNCLKHNYQICSFIQPIYDLTYKTSLNLASNDEEDIEFEEKMALEEITTFLGTFGK